MQNADLYLRPKVGQSDSKFANRHFLMFEKKQKGGKEKRQI
jgi:hypothetical protein